MVLFINCFMHLPLFAGVLCWSLFWCALLCVLSSFAIIFTKERELVALLLMYSWCHATVYVLWLHLAVPYVGLQCAIVVFPDHTYFLTFYLTCSEQAKQYKYNQFVHSSLMNPV